MLPPFPMYTAFPCSQYYGGAAPPASFGRRRAYPPITLWLRSIPTEQSQMVPTFTAIPVDELGTRLYPCGIAMTTP
jgi:hypothetical protein